MIGEVQRKHIAVGKGLRVESTCASALPLPVTGWDHVTVLWPLVRLHLLKNLTGILTEAMAAA